MPRVVGLIFCNIQEVAVARSETTQAVYLFIKDYIEQHTYPPSLREIGEGCFLSLPGVVRHLDRLEGEGKIEREPGRARSIKLTNGDELKRTGD